MPRPGLSRGSCPAACLTTFSARHQQQWTAIYHNGQTTFSIAFRCLCRLVPSTRRHSSRPNDVQVRPSGQTADARRRPDGSRVSGQASHDRESVPGDPRGRGGGRGHHRLPGVHHPRLPGVDRTAARRPGRGARPVPQAVAQLGRGAGAGGGRDRGGVPGRGRVRDRGGQRAAGGHDGHDVQHAAALRARRAAAPQAPEVRAHGGRAPDPHAGPDGARGVDAHGRLRHPQRPHLRRELQPARRLRPLPALPRRPRRLLAHPLRPPLRDGRLRPQLHPRPGVRAQELRHQRRRRHRRRCHRRVRRQRRGVCLSGAGEEEAAEHDSGAGWEHRCGPVGGWGGDPVCDGGFGSVHAWKVRH